MRTVDFNNAQQAIATLNTSIGRGSHVGYAREYM